MIEIFYTDGRAELFVRSLVKVFKAANLPRPIVSGGAYSEGLLVSGKPKEIGEVAKRLFEQLGYTVSSRNVDLGWSSSLYISIGRRPASEAIKSPSSSG